MIIAEQKRHENIAEYLLYMFQIEDIIRAAALDINLIEKQVIAKFDVPYGVKRDMREWYGSLISMMKDERKQEKGHLAILTGLIDDLNSLHIRLLNDPDALEYQGLYRNARSSVEALRVRNTEKVNDVLLMLNGLYGLLILRISKQSVSTQTEEAFSSISTLLAYLSAAWLSLEKGEQEFA